MKLNHAWTAAQFTALFGALTMTACTAASTEEPRAGEADTTATASQAVVRTILIPQGEMATAPCPPAAVGGVVGSSGYPGVPTQGIPDQGNVGVGSPGFPQQGF